MLRTFSAVAQRNNVAFAATRSIATSSICADRPRSSALGAMRKEGNSREGLDAELEDFGFDDSTTPGYDALEAQREVRKYLRLAKYEIPKLKAFARPFQPPTKSQVLRFRTSTYLGESNHPAAPKVVMTVPTGSLPLTDSQLHKFLLLVGPRYDPSEKLVKFSCEKFQDRAQNFKWLSDVLDRLIEESKSNPGQVADVPLDLRHAAKKLKPKPKFPKAWNRPVHHVQNPPRPGRVAGIPSNAKASTITPPTSS